MNRCVALGLDVLATLVAKRTKSVLDKGYTEARRAVQELSLDPCEQAVSILTGCSTTSDATEAMAVAGLQGVLGLLVVSDQQDESQVKRNSRRLREVGVCEALVVVLKGYPLSAAVTEVALNLINTLALLSSANKTKLGGLGVEALVMHARTHRPFASPIDGYAMMCDDAMQLVGRFGQSMHTINTSFQHTLVAHPLNTPYQHVTSTPLSSHPINTHYQHINDKITPIINQYTPKQHPYNRFHVGDEEKDLLASLTRARAEKKAEEQNKDKGTVVAIKSEPIEAYTWSEPVEGDEEEVEGVSMKDPVEVLVGRIHCVELKNTAAAGCGLNDMDIFVTLQVW